MWYGNLEIRTMRNVRFQARARRPVMTAMGAKRSATARFSMSDFQHGAEIQNETLPGLGVGRLNSRFRENGTEDSRRAALTQAAARRRGSRGQSPLAGGAINLPLACTHRSAFS